MYGEDSDKSVVKDRRLSGTDKSILDNSDVNRMYRCAICIQPSGAYASVEELEVHVAGDHLNFVPYECERCRFSKFPTEYALISHYTNDHALREFYVKYKMNAETQQKRQQLREIVQKSIAMSKVTIGHFKRKRTSNAEVLLCNAAGLSPCSSMDSDENIRGTETDKDVKAELSKLLEQKFQESEAERESSTNEKESNQNENRQSISGQTSTINEQSHINFSGILNDIFPHTSNSTVCTIDATEMDRMTDLSQNFFVSEVTASQSVPIRKRRPPRTCNICGLQVTGQRSSLIYHANSKHLRLPLFYCQPCKKTWTTVTKSDILKHVKAVHGGDESVVEDRRHQYAKDLHGITDKCFPPKHRGVNTEEPEGVMNPDHWMNTDVGTSLIRI